MIFMLARLTKLILMTLNINVRPKYTLFTSLIDIYLVYSHESEIRKTFLACLKNMVFYVETNTSLREPVLV